MRVSLIASTKTLDSAMWRAAPDWVPEGYGAEDAELLVEFAGRACYQSWNNPSGRSNEEYIGNIIEHAHFSVLEHASATFYVEGVSRSLTHELVRHRHFSPSQLSQRFVDSTTATYVVPPALRDMLDTHIYETDDSTTVQDILDEAFQSALTAYERLARVLTWKGLPRKQAREAARAVLPNMTATSIVVTGNHRTWREFVQKRHSVHADAEIRELAGQVLIHLRELAPAIYQDIPAEPYG